MENFHYRLLIIDDEPLGRELLQSSLSEHGFEVGTAKDGFAALAQMHGALPDLIVSDLKMPNMSGFEFLSMQPTAGRSDASLHFMKTRPSQATLAPASGG